MLSTNEILHRARAAKAKMCQVTGSDIDRALTLIAEAIEENSDKILAANLLDVEAAKEKLGEVMIDRLMLTDARIKAMADGIRKVVTLPSPIGSVLETHTADSGIVINKVCVPLGVLAVIYESRPNVTADAAALAIKSGNAVILRSGKEAHRSASAIVEAIRAALSKTALPKDAVQLIEDTTRASAAELMLARGYVDMLIPRGGAGLIRACVDGAKVPCLETGTGICHIYVDKSADTDMALRIIENAKTSRPSVCNAAEVCLVHKDIAKEFLPKLKKLLVTDRENKKLEPVKLIGDEDVCSYIDAVPMGDDDFDTEFLSYTMALGVVDDVRAAVAHISEHSTHHSEAIIANDTSAQKYFTENIDSAALYINASTRFTDGGEFGLGCEMGISTQKMHARGPVGIRELTTYKYVISGNGQIR